MNLEETISLRKAYGLIFGIVAILLVVGVGVGKLLFWEKYDLRSSDEKSLKRFKVEVSLNPEDPIAHVNLGWAYYQQGDLVGAEKEYRVALELEPKNISANYNLAVVLQDQEKLKEAEEYYSKVLELDSKHLLAFYGLGESLRLQREFVRAEDALKKALKIDGNAADILYQLGMVYEEWNKKEQAIEKYKKAVNLIPTYQPAWEGLKRLGQGNYKPVLPNHSLN